MKMVAAARLKRAEERANSIKPYSERLQSFLDAFDVDPNNLPSPLAEVRTNVKKIGFIVITSDKGLCGSYNSNVMRKARQWMAEQDVEKIKLFLIGKRAWDTYKKDPVLSEKVVEKYINLDQKLDYTELKEIADRVSKAYINGEVDELYILYSWYKSPAVCYPTVEKLLPVTKDAKEGEESSHEFADTIVEPSSDAVLGILFPKYVNTKLLMAIAQSFASEQGQRMVAMTNATDAAKDMVESLTLVYNKARQAAITNEILEIVSGAEALKG